jgi:hypothetical protein
MIIYLKARMKGVSTSTFGQSCSIEYYRSDHLAFVRACGRDSAADPPGAEMNSRYSISTIPTTKALMIRKLSLALNLSMVIRH